MDVVVEVRPEVDGVDKECVEPLEESGVGARFEATVEEHVVVPEAVDEIGGGGGGGDREGEGGRLVGDSVVTVTATVVGDSDSSTIFVDMIISVEGDKVLGGAVMVVVSSFVCVTVCISSVIVAAEAVTEPPSTATTE